MTLPTAARSVGIARHLPYNRISIRGVTNEGSTPVAPASRMPTFTGASAPSRQSALPPVGPSSNWESQSRAGDRITACWRRTHLPCGLLNG